jgi:23S rRNA (cytidine1920-2'-O)/16S rRNA (cytidine1409-2'-O)-methyltransferase
VVCIEKCHARDMADPLSALAAHTPSEGWELLVADLSFISLTLVLPSIALLMMNRSDALLLVKPQFELQPADIGKGGLVKDAALYVQVQDRLTTACNDAGLDVVNWLDSPVAGGDGNREFFIHVRRRFT